MSRVTIITLSSLLLVGLVGAVTFGFVTHWGRSDKQKVASTSKAVQAICNPTDYKDECVKSLADVRTDDPKELVKAAFASAKSELIKVSRNSTTLKELEQNPKTAQAVRDCKELFQDAIDDFQRSFDKIGGFEWDQVNNMLSDLKTWLSATRTYQETCLDGFENTTGDASVRVRKVLQTAMQMSSNGLAIVNDLSSLFTTLDISTFNRRRLLSYKTSSNRRLLGDDDDDDGSKGDVLLQDSEEDHRRKLLASVKVIGHSNNDLFLPEWIDGFRRKLLEATSLVDDDLKAKANVVVAQDGSGKYKTIEEALKDIPKNGNESFVIYIKEGVYNEYLVLFKWMTNVVFVGDGPTKTRITNNKNFADGTKTFKTATLSVLGDFFMAKDIGVENTAGAIKHQAVAFRAQSDKSIFYNCHFDGYQDTLYTHTYRQFYRDCRISGTIDFIFGDATAFFQNCTFVVRKPLENQNCIVTAQGRMERHQPTGIFIHKSRFEADSDYYLVKDKNKAYLGRPWKEYSKTIIMESEIGDFIQSEGWLPWEGTFGLDTSYYGEYNNAGPGSSLANRVKWRGIKTIVHDRAQKFMPPIVFENDGWIKASRVPYEPTLSGAPGPSGFDEDPNAPVGAPSSYPYDSLSTGSISGGSSGGTSSTTSHGSSTGSITSSKTSPSTPQTSSSSSSGSGRGSGSDSGSGRGTSRGSGSSSSDSSTEKASHESTTSGSGTSSKGSSLSTETTTSPSTTTTTSSTTDVANAPTAAPSPSTEAELTTPSPTQTPSKSPTDFPPAATQSTSPTNLPSTTTQQISPTNPASSLTSSTSTLNAKATMNVGPIKMRELERILMENEEMQGEDEVSNDDMSGNVPDGDEPSPARAEPPSPSPSPTPSESNTAISPSSAPSPASNGPSSDEEVTDWIPPATAPGPADDEEEADKVTPTHPPPKRNSGSKTKFESYVVLSGVFMWAALFM